MVVAMAMLVMVSCGKHELSGNIEDEKNMTITANKSDKDDYFMTGTLEVDEGDMVAIEPKLEEGSILIDFIGGDSDEENIEELPELDAEATYTANVSGENGQTVGLPEGDYMVKVTVAEKATGTVTISVKGQDD